jgi:hypothetical protein
MALHANLKERAHNALKRITMLSSEQQAIYKAALYRANGLTVSERIRLGQISYEIALAQNERNRARCGAPPVPPDYNPMDMPPIVHHQEDQEERPGRGHRKANREEVNEMRYLHVVKGWSAARIWRDFPHLKETTVRDILKNKTWYDPDYAPERASPVRKVRETVQRRARRGYPVES